MFQSGTRYNLKSLFAGDNKKIVIPDLQRDYCWGDSENDLVGRFIDTILSLDRDHHITLGLIYGYVNDRINPSHTQLCDGQQRLTTLFLLVGMINRYSNGRFDKILMSDFERDDDDQEPYLLYAIRESSLYFLSDLTVHFFLSSASTHMEIQEIEKQPWFLKSYQVDPTVRSILGALLRIEEKLKDYQKEGLPSLGEFITSNLEFLYYDMENRQNGEETFVVINTTGEALSSSQNLKPIIIKKAPDYHNPDGKDAAQTWEMMETWFWQNRNRNDGHQHTADEGMITFLQCSFLLDEFYTNYSAGPSNLDIAAEDDENAQQKWGERFPKFFESYNLLTNPTKKKEAEMLKYDRMSIDRIFRMYTAYTRLYKADYSSRHDGTIQYGNQSNTACRYTQAQLFSILPTLEYLDKFPNADSEDLKRIYHLFHNLSTYIDLTRPIIPTLRVIMAVSEMPSKDPLSLRAAKDFSKRFPEEIRKLNLIATAVSKGRDRQMVEYVLSDAENHPIMKGNKNIDVLLDWGDDDFGSIEEYTKRFSIIWKCHNGNLDDLDLLRRALLAKELKGYPYEDRYLCLTSDEWYKCITSSSQSVKEFVDAIDIENCEDSFMSVIDAYLTKYEQAKEKPFYTIVEDPTLLSICTQKRVYLHTYGLEVLNKKYHSANDIIIYNGKQYQTDLRVGKLKFYEPILFVDFNDYNLTIDLLYDENDGYKIMVWKGKMMEKASFPNLSILSDVGMSQTNEKGDIAFVSNVIRDHQQAHDELYTIIDKLESVS